MKMRRSRLPAEVCALLIEFPQQYPHNSFSNASAMDNECPPSRALATLASAGPNTLVYDAGRERVLTVTCSVSEIINLTL